MWGREAAEESETNLVDNGPEIIVMQPPSPERRAPEGDDNGNDKAQLIYASISSKHKQKKRFITLLLVTFNMFSILEHYKQNPDGEAAGGRRVKACKTAKENAGKDGKRAKETRGGARKK